MFFSIDFSDSATRHLDEELIAKIELKFEQLVRRLELAYGMLFQDVLSVRACKQLTRIIFLVQTFVADEDEMDDDVRLNFRLPYFSSSALPFVVLISLSLGNRELNCSLYSCFPMSSER